MGLSFGAVDCCVAIAAYRFQVRHIPRQKIKVSLADAALKWTDDMVNLVAWCNTALFCAFLTQPAIAPQHSFTDGPPSRIVVNQLMAALGVE